jgi:predicted metalloprotease
MFAGSRRNVVLLALLMTAGSACATVDAGVTATRARQIDDGPLIPDDTSPDAPPSTPGPALVEGVIDFGSAKPVDEASEERDAFLTAAIEDIVLFMEDFFPEVYDKPFEPLEGGIFAAYPERPSDEPIPGCGGGETSYADVEGNAFYCFFGDFIVYDDLLLKDLAGDLTLAGVGIVMAHEFGHSVQARIDEFDQPTILMEQQADCFAGAWTARVARGESDVLQFDDNDIKAGLVAMIEVRDPVQVAGTGDPNAHGSGFDRVGAFQEGFIGGPSACEPFFTEPRELDDTPFDFTDENQGNLPYVDEDPDPTSGPEDIITLIPADLDRYWSELAAEVGADFRPPQLVRFTDDSPATCEGIAADAIVQNVTYCAATNQILISDDLGFSLAEDEFTGDMSVGYLIAQGYSEAVQTQRGANVSGEERVLQNDCLTGTWVADIVPPLPADRDGLLLSAGDLDEVAIIAILRGDESSDQDQRGTAFDKIANFRDGFLNGLPACRLR